MLFKMLLYSFVNSISYLIIFYFLLPVTLKKWQVMIHIPASVVWAAILFIGTHTLPFEYKMFFSFFVELIYMIGTIYFFTEGDVFRNFFYFWFMFEIVNSVSVIYLSLFNSQFIDILLLPDIPKARVEDFLPYYVVIIVIVFIFRPILKKLAQFTEGYVFVYRYIMAGVMVIGLAEYIARNFLNRYKGMIMSSNVRVLLSLLACVIVIYVVVWLKRKSTEQQKQMLERATILVGERYKHLVEDNRDMKKFRHEINRHTEMMKGIEDFIPYSEIKNYLKDLEQKNSVFLEISLSGNLYLDSMVERYYKILKEQGIMLETVLEPIKVDDQMAVELICIMEELFNVVLCNIRYKKWCRLSVRVKYDMLLCQLEVGYGGRLEYYRRKFLDMLGDEMIVRHQLTKTRSIAHKRNGSVLYKLEKGKGILAVMVLK